MDRTQGSQKLGRWQGFLASFDQTIVHTAGKGNFIADAIYRYYIRIGTSTEEEDFIPESIDDTTLHRTPTLPTPPNNITCNHFSMPPLTPDMSESQSSASDFSHTDCEYKLCRSRGKAGGHHHTCPNQDDEDWEQFVTYSEDTKLQEITAPAEPLEPHSAPLTPIDPAIFEGYTPLTVEQIGVEAYQEDIVRMSEHYKKHKRDHWTTCNDEYGKIHYSSHLNRNRYLNPNFSTCSVCGIWGHGRMTCNIEGLILQKDMKELTLECNDIKAQALRLPPYHKLPEWASGSHAIATNTPCDEPSSPEEEFHRETAAVETRAMRKGTFNEAEPASTMHQHAAHIKERRETSAGTKTACSFCITGAKHRSDQCLQKTAIGNHIKVDNQ